jgi:GMP synthase-like glutamine amidotransferase
MALPPRNPSSQTRPAPVRVALLDLYDGQANQGMGALRALLADVDGRYGRPVQVETFDVRGAAHLPDLAYDIYISSGGPGGPFVGEGTTWDTRYAEWLRALRAHNEDAPPAEQTPALFICYSFQLLCRHLGLGAVTKRSTQSFGVVPVCPTGAGRTDPLLRGLPDPFWAADFRWWQVTRPDRHRLAALGGTILARETPAGADDPADRAVMGVRLASGLIGVQFHPEADPDGMLAHFRRPERRAQVIEQFGEAKYERLLRRLDEMDALRRTHATVVPAFLRRAIEGPPAAVPA